ncbi:MAG: hypothetical protein CMI16_07505 [Opitutaceae bacterium]|nr:hypothetical protein [Opitutaceae bacterium]
MGQEAPPPPLQLQLQPRSQPPWVQTFAPSVVSGQRLSLASAMTASVGHSADHCLETTDGAPRVAPSS